MSARNFAHQSRIRPGSSDSCLTAVFTSVKLSMPEGRYLLAIDSVAHVDDVTPALLENVNHRSNDCNDCISPLSGSLSFYQEIKIAYGRGM